MNYFIIKFYIIKLIYELVYNQLKLKRCFMNVKKEIYVLCHTLMLTETELGKEVKVFIDRPIGFNKEGITYTQNYGYIKELKAPDGEYQDAYVLGEDRPLKSFKGKVIAIINRLNDIEDKLIVCDKNSNYTKEEIRQMVNFQEKYFKSKIIIEKF